MMGIPIEISLKQKLARFEKSSKGVSRFSKILSSIPPSMTPRSVIPHDGTSCYFRTDFHVPCREASKWCMTFPILTYHFQPFLFQFHTLCIPLRSGTGYNRPRCGTVIEKTPHLHPQNSPVESLDPAAPRARAGVTWPAASKRDELSCAPECHYAARFPALIKWRAKCARHAHASLDFRKALAYAGEPETRARLIRQYYVMRNQQQSMREFQIWYAIPGNFLVACARSRDNQREKDSFSYATIAWETW